MSICNEGAEGGEYDELKPREEREREREDGFCRGDGFAAVSTGIVMLRSSTSSMK